jgi:hypothetical protein
VKHNLICDPKKVILYVSCAYNGATHDKKIADLEGLFFSNQKAITQYQDTGYQGYNPDNVTIIQPLKKPKARELTDDEKEENKKISSKRVIVEHAIGGMKILRIIKDEIRIYKESTRNIIMQIACAIHNLKMSMIKIN